MSSSAVTRQWRGRDCSDEGRLVRSRVVRDLGIKCEFPP